MKNIGFNIKEKIKAKYFDGNQENLENKSTNINILLNRVRQNQKKDNKKKLYFSAAASTGLLLFGLLIF